MTSTTFSKKTAFFVSIITMPLIGNVAFAASAVATSLAQETIMVSITNGDIIQRKDLRGGKLNVYCGGKNQPLSFYGTSHDQRADRFAIKLPQPGSGPAAQDLQCQVRFEARHSDIAAAFKLRNEYNGCQPTLYQSAITSLKAFPFVGQGLYLLGVTLEPQFGPRDPQDTIYASAVFKDLLASSVANEDHGHWQINWLAGSEVLVTAITNIQNSSAPPSIYVDSPRFRLTYDLTITTGDQSLSPNRVELIAPWGEAFAGELGFAQSCYGEVIASALVTASQQD